MLTLSSQSRVKIGHQVGAWSNNMRSDLYIVLVSVTAVILNCWKYYNSLVYIPYTGNFWRQGVLAIMTFGRCVNFFYWFLFSLFQGLLMKACSRVYFSLCLFLAISRRSQTPRIIPDIRYMYRQWINITRGCAMHVLYYVHLNRKHRYCCHC